MSSLVLDLLWLVVAFPLAGFFVLALMPGWSRRSVSCIGVGSVGAAAVATAVVGLQFVNGQAPFHRTTAWTWIDSAGLSVGVTGYLDALSLLMVAVITGVGFLIHLYSTEYMQGDEGYQRFFAYMNLFVASMLTLVLADNLLLLYVGWEGVGLCSYLLIGFWYRKADNGAAAQKAFIVTRIGDTAMAIGLLALFTNFHTLSIQGVQAFAAERWTSGSGIAMTVAALLLAGALGKSAQVPLQVWLPDAMAGPTPVSALIHAATMVTAGVYLIARMDVLFVLAPAVHLAVAIIGVVTLLLAGLSALVQRDIKRILAYSTISQIGYMFLALGVGAWPAAMFHFFTHACFKALLFLAAGAVIVSLHHEQDIFRMGGLRRALPITFWTFLIGAAALSGVPFVTSGFYSKEWILSSVLAAPHGTWLWLGGAIGALVTGLYSFRLIFRVFYGELRTAPTRRPGVAMVVPLLVLAVASIVVGFLEMPPSLGDVTLFSRYLDHSAVFPDATSHDNGREVLAQLAVSIASVSGIALAAWLFLPGGRLKPTESRAAPRKITDIAMAGWGFDALYHRLFLRPWNAMTRTSTDGIDHVYGLMVDSAQTLHTGLSRTQTGLVRWYAASLAIGAVLLLGWFAL
jgi:NADH-quinone oxidoreductase subunit L